MPVTPVELSGFGGLSLHGDPQEISVGGAVDLVNVDFDRPGILRSRPGTTLYATATDPSTHAGRTGLMVPFYGTYNQLICAVTVNLSERWVVFNSTGGMLAATTTAGSSADWGAAVVGTPGNHRCYVSDGGASGLSVWNGTVWNEHVAGTPSAAFLAVQQPDDRLVAGYATLGGVGGQDHVYFSDPGAPETWGANNYVQLTPGDGEYIGALVTWRDVLFVFKQSKFFVFYGNSTDGQGNPVFNYRAVDTGIGVVGKGLGAAFACAGREGVYFLAHDGIYLTTGGAPAKVSEALDPLFNGQTLPLFSNTFTPDTSARYHRLAYADGKLFVHLWCSGITAYRTLVYYPATRQWGLWDTGCGYTVDWSLTGVDGPRSRFLLPYEPTTGTRSQRILQMSESATTDAGTAITASYRTGFWNIGTPGTESWVREWLVDGTGTVTTKTAVNDSATLGSGQAVALGTPPAVAQGRDRRGVRGRNVSINLAGTAPWSVSRVTGMVWSQTAPGMKSA